MTNVLVKKILLLAFMLSMMSMASAQSISYKSAYDLSSGVTLVTNYNVSAEQPLLQGVIFSPDGLKMYTIGSSQDEINQFSLSVAFDLTSTITHDGSLSTVGVSTTPTDLVFSSDGTKLFINDSQTVEQYSLTVAYDITQTTTFDVAYSTGSGSRSFQFSPDGQRMFVAKSTGFFTQYALTNAFDLSSATFLGNSEVFLSGSFGFTFNSNGTKLFSVTPGTDEITQYSLSTPYDLLSEITTSETVIAFTDPSGITFNNDGTQLYLSAANGNVTQLDLTTPLFRESAANNGSVVGTFPTFALTGETFTNAGGTLTFNTDYQISNLPAGLTPTLAIGSDGKNGTLSFSGSVSNHQNSNDVASLTFTFANSAFTGGNATSVTNAIGASSGISLDFRNNYTPSLSVGGLGESATGTLDPTTFSVASQDTQPLGLAVNNDGTRLFVLGNFSNTVYEYSLSIPYNITSGVAYTGNSFSVNSEENVPRGLTFSTDGLKMFVGGRTGDDVNQYSLSQPFDITSTIVHEGSFSVASETISMDGITFAPHGYTMYVSGLEIYTYSLTNPFDITSGVSYVSTFDTPSSTTDIIFDRNGREMQITGFSAGSYSLSVPYDLTTASLIKSGGATANFQINNPDGTSIVGLNTGSDAFVQQNFFVKPFEESYENDGSILGSQNIYLSDDSFVNTGSTLTEGIHYSVTGLPSGLNPVLSVNEDGTVATFTISGNATNNDITDNFSDIEFTFTDAAFFLSDASEVVNSTNVPAFVEVEFKEIQPQVYADPGFTTTGLTYSGNSYIFSAENGNIGGFKFSNDGLKLYIVDKDDDEINQYSLSSPYNVHSATHDGAYDVSSLDNTPTALAFNPDGTRVYIAGTANDLVYQYSLTTPYDLLGTKTLDGSSLLIFDPQFALGINPLDLFFAPDGGRLFAPGTAEDAIYQYALDAPYDITSLYLEEKYIVEEELNSAPGLGFSPDGSKMMVLGVSSDRIFSYTLTSPYDVSTASYDNNSFYLGSQDIGSHGFTFSSSGDKMYMIGLINKAIYEYEYSNPGFTELATNNGSVTGSFDFKIAGTQFTNAGGTLSASAFNATGVPDGLSAVISISGDGTSATLTFTGQANNHQDTDDTEGITITLLDGAFTGATATEVANSSLALVLSFDFEDNGTITYTPVVFQESYENLGEVNGSMLIQIANETFTSAGTTLAEGVDYSISGVPSGLVPNLAVAANGLSATLTFTGSSDNNQNSNDVADLVFTFENSAFTTSDADLVFNALGASSGSSIDFNDNSPKITFGTRLDLTAETPELSASFSIVDQEDSPGGMAFSADGMKIFIVGFTNDAVFEYDLTNQFDISTGVSYSGNSFDISAQVNSPSDLTFDPSGTTMFIMDGSGDEVEQYTLSTPYDLSTVTHQGSYDVGSQDIQPAAITFNSDGKKMYMIGSFNNQVHQYTLSNPFDVTSSVTYDGSPFTVVDRNYTGIGISENGKSLFVANGPFPSAAYIRQYDFNTPLDITDGMTEVGSFYFGTEGPSDFEVSSDGKKFFVLRAFDDVVQQYDLPFDGFVEVSQNNGEVAGSLYIEIRDERFTNAGSTMTYGSDYTITNLPAGLTASLSVASNGLSATLSLSGNADDHQNINDVEPQFSFNNSAFEGGNAGNVMNASGVGSTRLIDFNDNNPVVLYGDPLNMANATYSGTSFDPSSQDPYPTGIAFNGDGTTMFIAGGDNSFVYEYSLSVGFDLASTVTYTGNSVDVSVNSENPEDMYISTDGTRMYILTYNGIVVQYNLATAFNLSTASFSGNSFDITAQGDDVYSLTLSSDGSKMYVVSTSNEEINQYSLSTAFDLSTVSYDGDPLDISNEEYSPTGIIFSQDGYYLLVVGDGEYAAARYRLNAPFDLTQGAIFDGTLFNLEAQNDGPSGVGSSPDGSRIFVLDGSNVDIEQYNIDAGGFTETIANNGAVEGSANIYMIDDTFTNAGGTLAFGSDYGINNLPAGFTPSLSVAADGYSATLTLTGSVASHGNTEDIASLQFNLFNSAFSNYDASEVGNATNFNSNIGIDYLPYTGNDITGFTFSEINDPATINSTAHTVTVEAVAGTDISALSPTLTLSQAATVSPNSNVEQDFASTFTYTVTAEDGTAQDWDVTITEALADPTDITMSSSSIDENSSPGTVVGEFATVDASFDETFTYSLIAGDGDTDNSAFQISDENLLNEGNIDFETKSSYSIRVETNDGNGGLFEKALIITVNDVNEVPTEIQLSSTNIDESNPVGTVIGILSTTDVDANDTHTYTIDNICEGCASAAPNAAGDPVEIVGNELRTGIIFDFETGDPVSFTVRSTDSGGLFTEENFLITINDLPASVTSLDLTNQAVNENEAIGTTVGSLITTGEDLSGTYVYTFASGAGDTDNGDFTISDNVLTTASTFDFEVKDSYTIRVKTDDGIGNTFEEVFVIAIDNVFEAPTDLSISGTSIAENNLVNEVIGSLSTTDEDAGETYSYALVSGTGDADNAAFNINGEELRATEVFDFETKNSFSVRIETNDGNGGTFQKSLTISVTDENESIVVTAAIEDQNLLEDFASLDIDISNVFTDQDGDALTFSATSSDVSIVTVSVSGSTLTLAEAGFGSSTITVTADDGSGVTTSDDFIVTVTEVFSTETDITAFSFTQQTSAATIDVTNHTITVEVADGSNLSSLTPTIEVSVAATISPSGAQDFTAAFTYTVTAEDGTTTQDWAVTVTVEEVPLGFEDEVIVQVYPNPVVDYLSVKSEDQVQIRLIDMNGRILDRQSGNDLKLDMTALSRGTYVLLLTSNGVTTTQRIIKAN